MTLPAIALYAALQTARAAWGTDTAATIQLAPLSDCKPHGLRGVVPMIAWSDFATRTITLNSNCGKRWNNLRVLQSTVTHELGHLIAGTPDHSPDRHSVMYYQITGKPQAITPADRAQRKLFAASAISW